jgi:hypothetical protein
MSTVRKLYSSKKVADELGVSAAYICAVKKMMFKDLPPERVPRWLDLEAVSQWIHDHPDFRVHHVWGAKARRAWGPLR